MKARSLLLVASLLLTVVPAGATPLLLVDASSGDILAAQEPTRSWHPASLTKLMTAHVALMAVQAGRLSMDTSIGMSARAVAQAPTKLGLPEGSTLRLEDALRVMLVKSTNDVAVAVAEAVSGDEATFVAAMNAEARRLGMSGTRFVNANGLHDDRQVTNARDMAVLLRTIVNDHSEYTDLLRTPSITVNGRILKNTNKLIEDFAGVEATKTGYVCASGFNAAVSAVRGGRHVIGVVLGSRSAAERTLMMRRLLESGLAGSTDPIGNLRTWRAEGPALAADLRPLKCGRANPASEKLLLASDGARHAKGQALRR